MCLIEVIIAYKALDKLTINKWFVYKTNNIIDVALFVLAGIATVKLGVTITAALTVAGLGYTMIYAPYVRKQISKRKNRLAENERINKILNKRNINY